jgi:hypothetical protein
MATKSTKAGWDTCERTKDGGKVCTLRGRDGEARKVKFAPRSAARTAAVKAARVRRGKALAAKYKGNILKGRRPAYVCDRNAKGQFKRPCRKAG